VRSKALGYTAIKCL